MSEIALKPRLSFNEDSTGTLATSNESDPIVTTNRKATYLQIPQSQLLMPPSMMASERRQSQWNLAKKSLGPTSRRYSQSITYGSRKSSQDLQITKIRYQNTYKMEPDENTQFYAYKVEPKLYATLEHTLKDCKYEAKKCALLSKELSEDILRETRNCLVNPSRYKLIAHVVIGQLKEQDVRVASRCLWDTTFDNYITVMYKNSELFATATLYALYYE